MLAQNAPKPEQDLAEWAGQLGTEWSTHFAGSLSGVCNKLLLSMYSLRDTIGQASTHTRACIRLVQWLQDEKMSQLCRWCRGQLRCICITQMPFFREEQQQNL